MVLCRRHFQALQPLPRHPKLWPRRVFSFMTVLSQLTREYLLNSVDGLPAVLLFQALLVRMQMKSNLHVLRKISLVTTLQKQTVHLRVNEALCPAVPHFVE